MAFQFPLATLMRFRESAESSAELALNRTVSEMAGVRLQLDEVERCEERLREQRDLELVRRTLTAYVHEITDQEKQLTEVLRSLHQQLQALETRRVAQLETYQAARREREILSELLQRQYQSYRREQARKEQAMLDEMFLARREPGN